MANLTRTKTFQRTVSLSLRAEPNDKSESKDNVIDVDEELGWEEWDGSMPFWKHAIAGSSAGIMEHVGMYPMDTIKTHMQALRPGRESAPGIAEVAREIIAERGVLGFMRGAAAIGSGCIPAHAALFCTYEVSKKSLLSKEADHEPLRAAACGAISTLSHDSILTPCDVVKQRLQLGCYSGTLDCLRSLWKYDGLGGLYRSMPTTLLINMPYGSTMIAANESLKTLCGLSGQVHRGEMQKELPWYFLAAGIAGALASVVTQPLDVIKTRLQTQEICFQSTSSQQPPKYSGFVEAARSIYINEGSKGFCRGMVPRMIQAVPASAICWGTYETLKAALH